MAAMFRLLPVLVMASALPAYSQVPSADQLGMFQTLSPEQQQAILDSMTGGQEGSAGGMNDGLGGRNSASRCCEGIALRNRSRPLTVPGCSS